MSPDKPASILVTDDESNIRLTVRAALETEGYVVTEAADGRAALAAVERDRPDLMLLDLNMPVLDGMAVLDQLQSVDAGRRPRVIVLTAYGSVPAAVRATRLGAADFLEKPVLPDELRRAVRGVLDEPDGAARPDPPGGYEQALDQVRKALRLMDLSAAEAALTAAITRRDRQAAAHLNLLGVLYESQHRWRLARRFYGKAIDADPAYEPAKTNFLRVEQVERTGRSDLRVCLGDEPDDAWYAQVPDRRDEQS